jgi:hypothetical protein
LGCVATVDPNWQTICIADAHRFDRMEFTHRGGQAPAETFKEKSLQK